MRFELRPFGIGFLMVFCVAGCGNSDAGAGPAGPDASAGGGTPGGGGSSGNANAGGSAGTVAAGGGAGTGMGGASNDGGASNGGASNDGGATGNGGSANTGGAAGGTTGGGSACKGIVATVTSPAASGAKVAVSVDATASGCTVAPDFMGTNYESFSGWGADVSLSAFQKTAFQSAGMQLFRYPGGEPAEWFDLLMTGKCSDNSNANWGAPAYTALWSFAQSAGLHSLMLQTNP